MQSRSSRSKRSFLVLGALFILLFVGTGTITLAWLSSIRNDTSHVITTYNRKIELLNSMANIARGRELGVYSLMFISDPWVRDEEYMDYYRIGAEFIHMRDEYLNLGLSEYEQKVFDKALSIIRLLQPMEEGLIESINSNQSVNINLYIEEYSIPLRSTTQALLDKLISYSSSQALLAQKQSDQAFAKALYFLTFTFIAATILGLLSLMKAKTIITDYEHELLSRADRLNWDANHDPLTKLLNRRGFKDFYQRHGRRSISENTTHSLIYIDLDNFKPINDQYGHNFGDLFLIQIAKCFSHCVRQSDAIARMGGDEFAILLLESDLSSANRVAECICNKMRVEGFQIEGKEIKTTSSIGITEFNPVNTDYETILKQADKACYNAKHEGKDTIATKSLLH